MSTTMSTVAQVLADLTARIDRIGARANEMGYTLVTSEAVAAANDVATLKTLLSPTVAAATK